MTFYLVLAPGEIMIFAIFALILVSNIVFISNYRIAPPGYCLIRSGAGGRKVHFDQGVLILPGVHKFDQVPISLSHFTLNTVVTFRDGVKKEVEHWYCVRPNKTQEDVLNVLDHLGIEKIGDSNEMKKLFEEQFSKCIQEAAAEFDSETIDSNMYQFFDKLLDKIGCDLNGLNLEDAALKVK